MKREKRSVSVGFAITLTDSQRLDRLVADGSFPKRCDAIRAIFHSALELHAASIDEPGTAA